MGSRGINSARPRHPSLGPKVTHLVILEWTFYLPLSRQERGVSPRYGTMRMGGPIVYMSNPPPGEMFIPASLS